MCSNAIFVRFVYVIPQSELGDTDFRFCPTLAPTSLPTISSTQPPIQQPTASPIAPPTTEPTDSPTNESTLSQTPQPTTIPSLYTSTSLTPTGVPTMNMTAIEPTGFVPTTAVIPILSQLPSMDMSMSLSLNVFWDSTDNNRLDLLDEHVN
jgi:hypothetical protein